MERLREAWLPLLGTALGGLVLFIFGAMLTAVKDLESDFKRHVVESARERREMRGDARAEQTAMRERWQQAYQLLHDRVTHLEYAAKPVNLDHPGRNP